MNFCFHIISLRHSSVLNRWLIKLSVTTTRPHNSSERFSICILDSFLIRILMCWFSFLHEFSGWGFAPSICYLNWMINKISFPFCPENVSNYQTSLNMCFSRFFFLWFVLANCDCSSIILWCLHVDLLRVSNKVFKLDPTKPFACPLFERLLLGGKKINAPELSNPPSSIFLILSKNK